jgi:hypothetical protein
MTAHRPFNDTGADLTPLHTGDTPLNFDHTPDLKLLKHIMGDHGYSREALIKTGGLPRRGLDLDVREMLRRTADLTPFNTLARLFLLAREVPRDDAQAAIAPIPLSSLLNFGLLRPGSAPDRVRGLCAMVPFGDMLMLRDFEPHVSGVPIGPDHVLGVGVATMVLANITVRRGNERFLDIGTGQGFHALVACDHARQVIATDINARALAMAKAAAFMNACERVELRTGSLMDPVAGEDPFDLIVSNPPFVIAPPHDTIALGGRHIGDDLCRDLIRMTPAHLAPDGFATILFSWHHADDNDWRTRPTQWLEGLDADALVIKFRTDPVEAYARRWLIESGHGASAQDASRASVAEDAVLSPQGESPLEEWLAFYAKLGAHQISMGACILHRRTSHQTLPPWRRFENLAMDSIDESASSQIQRLFAGETRRRHHAAHPDAILSWRPKVTRELEVEQHLVLTEEHSWGMRQAALKQTLGFPLPLGIDGVVMEVLRMCDGSNTINHIVHRLATHHGAPEAQAKAQTIHLIDRLLNLGYMEPGGDD